MATLKMQQKEKLVKMLSKYYTLGNEASINNFIGNIANDYTDREDARLELTLMAYALMGIDSNAKTIRIHFNPNSKKIWIVKALKEIPELSLDLKSAKEIVDACQITLSSIYVNLLEKVKIAIINNGGTIEQIEIL